MENSSLPLAAGYYVHWCSSGYDSVPTPEGWRVYQHGHGPVRRVEHVIDSQQNLSVDELIEIVARLAAEMEAKFHEEVERRIQEKKK
jgi:hypothetical protein